jgi:hypothetical protein
MLKSLWLRLPSPGPSATEERALARYFRDEGLHAEFQTLRTQESSARSEYERALYSAHSYFAA